MKPIRPWSLQAAVLPLADGARTCAEIGKMLGAKPASVLNAINSLRKRGVDVRIKGARRGPPSKFPTEELLALADGVNTYADIAAKLGRTANAVRQIIFKLRRQGTPIPIQDARIEVDPARNAAIIEAIKAGATLEAVGQRHGITRERVRQICKKAGVLSALNIPGRKALTAERKAAKAQDIAERKAALKARNEKLRRLVEIEGLSLAKAGSTLGFGRGKVHYLNQSLGLKTRYGRWRPELAELKQKAIEVWKSTNGRSKFKAAKEATGLTYATIHLVLARAGLTPFNKFEIARGLDHA